jgi:hypothetical protein
VVDANLFAQLEKVGLENVKRDLDMGMCGQVGSEHHNSVSAWVKLQEEAIASAAAARAEAREDRMLSISANALSIAKEDLAMARSSAESARLQARWAMWAAIIATVAAIVATFKA